MLMYGLVNIGPLETTGLVILFGLSAVGAIIIASFAVSRVDKHQPDPNAAYIENIRVLNDTIQALKFDIELYKQKVCHYNKRTVSLKNSKITL